MPVRSATSKRLTGDAARQEPDLPTAENLKDLAGKATDAMKDKAAAFSNQAVEKVDEGREPAAHAIESAASALREEAKNLPGGGTITNLAHKTADKLQSTADYVREHDTRGMNLGRFVKDHPAQSLAVAAAFGFLLGRAFRRD